VQRFGCRNGYTRFSNFDWNENLSLKLICHDQEFADLAGPFPVCRINLATVPKSLILMVWPNHLSGRLVFLSVGAAFSAELPDFPDVSLISVDAILRQFWERFL